jgi:hypothetical protein
MGVNKHMTIHSKFKENDYKKITSELSITFFSTIGKLDHDVNRHSRGIVSIHTKLSLSMTRCYWSLSPTKSCTNLHILIQLVRGIKNQSSQHITNPTLFNKFKQGIYLGGNIIVRERARERERETHTHTHT